MIGSSAAQSELHQSRQDSYEASRRHRLALLDPGTGLVRSELVELRDCPACFSTDKRKLFVKDGGTYNRCLSCQTIYLCPVLKDDHLAEYYANNHAFQAQSHVDESDFYRAIYSHGLDVIQRHSGSGLLLDVGCSAGAFMEIAQERRFEVRGLELNCQEAEIARSRGFTVAELDLVSLDSGETFDAISLWDVFEHLKRPDLLLRKALSLLNEGGVLFLQIPSADSLSARVLQERCNMFDGVEHVALYTHSSIRDLLEREKFEILEIIDVIDDRAAILNHLDFDDPYAGSSSGQLGDLFSVDFLLNNELGYKMQILARKA